MSKLKLKESLAQFHQVRRELPVLLANDARNYFVKAFRNAEWEGKKWKTPQRRIPGTKAYKYPIGRKLARRTRATLVESGILRRAVSNSIRSVSWNRTTLVVDLPYAARHNYGKDGMPQRQYMGDTKELRKIQHKTIKRVMERTWQT